MFISSKKEPTLLLMGDLLCFFVSLWLALFIRYFRVPSVDILNEHIPAFAILFVVWIFVFFITGLYEKHTLIFKNRLQRKIFNVQFANSIVAVIFFYLIPYFGISPKTNLFIYIIISFALVLLWRRYGVAILDETKAQKGLIIGSGEEVKEVINEVNNNRRYNIEFVDFIDLEEPVKNIKEKIGVLIKNKDVSVIIINLEDKKVELMFPYMYKLIFSGIKFADTSKVYEEIFDRIPLALIKYDWFLENVSKSQRAVYDFLKRTMDVFVSLLFGSASLIIYPFVMLAIKIDSVGPIFICQNRVGRSEKNIKIYKFRTMFFDDAGKRCLDTSKINGITKVGNFLRKTRIDELPQLWNVLKGDLSLIGPRPEIPEIAGVYDKEISFYNVRHLIKPGLSGWAQLYQEAPPKFKPQTDQTRIKLSYDLYYIKNRSLFLDFKIALKTIKVLFSKSGV